MDGWPSVPVVALGTRVSNKAKNCPKAEMASPSVWMGVGYHQLL